MKKINLLIAFLGFATCLSAQIPLSGSYTDCNNRTEDIQATLGNGYALIIAHKAVDCSACMLQAPSLETWASQNSGNVKVWTAMTWKYNPNTFSNPCQATASWVTTYSWSSIFTFPDTARAFNNNASPTYYVYSPRDSTIKYQGSNRNTAYSVALQESTVGIQDQRLKASIDWSLQAGVLNVNNENNQSLQLRVVDLKGSVVKEANLVSGSNLVDLSVLKQSIYLLQFQSEAGTYVEKVFIQ